MDIGMNIIVAAPIIHIPPVRYLRPVIPAGRRFIDIQSADVQRIGIIRIDAKRQRVPADGGPVIVAPGGNWFGNPG